MSVVNHSEFWACKQLNSMAEQLKAGPMIVEQQRVFHTRSLGAFEEGPADSENHENVFRCLEDGGNHHPLVEKNICTDLPRIN